MHDETEPCTSQASPWGQGPHDLLDDEAERLYDAAAAHEDAMMRLLASSADLENRALTEVARYEEQRVIVGAALARLHAAEMDGSDPYEARDAFLAAESEKNRLWTNVEALWAESKRCLLWAGERRERAEHLRDEASRLFAQADAIAQDVHRVVAAKTAA